MISLYTDFLQQQIHYLSLYLCPVEVIAENPLPPRNHHSGTIFPEKLQQKKHDPSLQDVLQFYDFPLRDFA
jgi:hypothetical protein